MKFKLSNIIFLLLILLSLFLIIYPNIKNKQNDKKLEQQLYAEKYCIQGYKYGIKYLYDKNLVRTDTVVYFNTDSIIYPNEKIFDADDFFFASYKYCIIDAYQKGYLIKRDSLLEEMLYDYYNIKMIYYKNINKK